MLWDVGLFVRISQWVDGSFDESNGWMDHSMSQWVDEWKLGELMGGWITQ